MSDMYERSLARIDTAKSEASSFVLLEKAWSIFASMEKAFLELEAARNESDN